MESIDVGPTITTLDPTDEESNAFRGPDTSMVRPMKTSSIIEVLAPTITLPVTLKPAPVSVGP